MYNTVVWCLLWSIFYLTAIFYWSNTNSVLHNNDKSWQIQYTHIRTFCLSFMEPRPSTAILVIVSSWSRFMELPFGPNSFPTKLNCNKRDISESSECNVITPSQPKGSNGGFGKLLSHSVQGWETENTTTQWHTIITPIVPWKQNWHHHSIGDSAKHERIPSVPILSSYEYL
jgi:hypothetical protein